MLTGQPQPPSEKAGGETLTGLQGQSLTRIPEKESLYKMPREQSHIADRRYEEQLSNQVHLPGQVNSSPHVVSNQQRTLSQQKMRQGNPSSLRIQGHQGELPHYGNVKHSLFPIINLGYII